MRIRSKIFLLVTSSMLLMVTVIGIYVLRQAAASRIESERRVLLKLNDSVKDLIAAINIFDSGQIDSSFARFKTKRTAADTAAARVAGLVELPRVDASLKESLEIIGSLGALANEDLDRLTSSYEELRSDALKYLLDTNVTTLRDFYTNDYARGKYDLGPVFSRLDDLVTLSAGLTDTLTAYSDVIAEKNLLVDEVLAASAIRTATVSGGAAIGLVATALILAFMFSRSLARPVVAIGRTFAAVSSGDLTVRAKALGKDELALLGTDLNGFLSALSLSIVQIKGVSQESLGLKEELGLAVAEASSSATEIGASSESIRRRIADLDGRISGARDSLEAMTKGIVEYSARVAEQDVMVYKSAQSVEGMLSSLASIATLAQNDRMASARLEKAAAEGRVVFGDTFNRLSGIAKNIDTINEMARVIEDIASRTNLLAMNAAIEAAHAGNSGKGFAVVADEIRKLAAAASESSRSIGETLGSVSELGKQAAGSRDRASTAFSEMDAQIGNVAASARDVDALIVAIREEADALLGSVRSLRQVSSRTAEGAAGIETAARSVEATVTEVARVSGEVNSNSAEISVGLGDITAAVDMVSALAQRIGESGMRLDSAINYFRTEAIEDA